MTRKELMALSDAAAEAFRQGLKRAGRHWYAEAYTGTAHDYNTIQSLVEKGWLRLWGPDQVAHITDAGIEALEQETEEQT